MKKYIILLTVGLFSISCNAQDNKTKKNDTDNKQEVVTEKPKGRWKVDKEFDENGNLVKYDSIYSWSSSGKLNDLTAIDKDSLLNSFESKFYRQFSEFKSEGFEDVFKKDSLFGKHFFNDEFFNSDFGMDFMDLDEIHKKMKDRQKEFLKKYQFEFQEAEQE